MDYFSNQWVVLGGIGVALVLCLYVAYRVCLKKRAPPARNPFDPDVTPEERERRRVQKEKNQQSINTLPRITKAELQTRKGMLVGICGHVFDVSSRAQAYRTGYSVFLGKDASRGFATASTKSDTASDDISGLEPKHMKALREWYDFYMERYPLVAMLTDSLATVPAKTE